MSASRTLVELVNTHYQLCADRVTFADGVIAVTKVSDHTELLAVLRADSIDMLDVKEPSSVWVDELGIEYTFDRELIALPPEAKGP